MRFPHLLILSSALLGPAALAQTAPAAPAKAVASAATNKSVSALAVEVGSVVKGRLMDCPASLKLSVNAVCLYVQTPATSLRPLVRGKLGARAGDWKTTGKSSVLLVKDVTPNFVLLSTLSDKETLVVVDAAPAAKAAAPAKVATPAGVVKGQPYVLGSDLVGVVKVTALGSGKYRLSNADQGTLTVTVGQRAAQTDAGAVELPLAPATDGKNLIFPLSGLRALGCTATPNGGVLTVACGSDSVGLKPIVF
ncbi:hypothetical protein [Deinococcus radiotolerans]|uniref:Uncharacterized protein n=1 Tax=Deinococcus radiotolerans TaxID=1309407 RepID=A0ABQ2FQB1_9DEIO|nr:hypothetical protein [Deinococcus radiotolerans]GGL16349.1 hypothetical protein GCM10010844_39060 [Deinococcus radiotolerans]